MRVETAMSLSMKDDILCGIYSRVARRLGVDRTYVSKVAKGERRSQEIETALIREFDRSREQNKA
jgi:transcriptional regulator with XRE-family HTH domain